MKAKTITAERKGRSTPSGALDHHEPPRRPGIQREDREDAIVVLRFDRQESAANVFDPDSLAELEQHLDAIAADGRVSGLILASAKERIFMAGADLDFVSRAGAEGEQLTAFIESGQRVFSKLAALDVPTVAAIHGACLGGGLEMALACDVRLASDDKATRLGLPETQLGILPAWGGSTRLPRLIGLPKALDLIVAGKVLTGSHARKLGVVDRIVPRERLMGVAIAAILGHAVRQKRQRHWLTNHRFGAALIRRLANRKVLNRTRGNYPAISAAIDVVCRSVSVSGEASLENERRAIIELAAGRTAENLLRIFHLQEAAKKSSGASVPAVDLAAVVGAGVMGAGIAHWLASRHIPTMLTDLDEDKVAGGMKRIGDLFAMGVRRRLFSEHEAMRMNDRLFPAAERVPLGRSDLVIEAAVENLEVKKAIFRDLCSRVGDDAILATNTSALPIGEIADDPKVTHPERIIGLHFFNPVHRMKLVEVVITDRTSLAVVDVALAFVRRLGKLPVVVRDRPGFVVNRVLMPYLIEAGRLFERGVDGREIDEAMLDFGMPMGPLRLIDEVGLDVALHVTETMEAAFGKRFTAPAVLRRLVDQGHLGRKSGAGFFCYDSKSESLNASARALQTEDLSDTLKENDIAERLSLLMVNESLRVLDEGVAQSGNDVDLAMILGTGFAPFRGGPVAWAEHLGHDHVRERLEAIAAAGPEEAPIFQPAERLMHGGSAATPKPDRKEPRS